MFNFFCLLQCSAFAADCFCAKLREIAAIGGGTGGGLPPSLFVRDALEGPNLHVYFYNITSA